MHFHVFTTCTAKRAHTHSVTFSRLNIQTFDEKQWKGKARKKSVFLNRSYLFRERNNEINKIENLSPNFSQCEKCRKSFKRFCFYYITFRRWSWQEKQFAKMQLCTYIVRIDVIFYFSSENRSVAIQNGKVRFIQWNPFIEIETSCGHRSFI